MTLEFKDENTPLPAMKAGVEAIQIEHEGKPMVLLHDQEGLGSPSIAVSVPAFLIAAMLDGRTSVSAIQSAFTKNMGQMLSAGEIQNLVAQLDKSDLLETDSLQLKRRKIHDEFLTSPVRKAMHGGNGYPENGLDLAVFL